MKKLALLCAALAIICSMSACACHTQQAASCATCSDSKTCKVK